MGVWDDVSGRDAVTVRLRFTPQAGYRVLRSTYPSMVDPLILLDGSVEFEIRTRGDTRGLSCEGLTWILSWGEEVEVMGPPSIRALWFSALCTDRRNDIGDASLEPL
ncbi:hypothetical protein Dcar01_01660 [Deinococcus carri]|uniref:WCX domain-containing protein n=1 Tax=Deinococcus carri TaxID=1211323 RepID=A0ABP9W737_9DEIO